MRCTSVARVSARFSAMASAMIPVLAGAVSVLLWLFVDAPDVHVAQAGKRRLVQASGRGDPCGGVLVHGATGPYGPHVARGGYGGQDPFRVGGVAVQDEDAPWTVAGGGGIVGHSRNLCFRSGPGSRWFQHRPGPLAQSQIAHPTPLQNDL